MPRKMYGSWHEPGPSIGIPLPIGVLRCFVCRHKVHLQYGFQKIPVLVSKDKTGNEIYSSQEVVELLGQMREFPPRPVREHSPCVPTMDLVLRDGGTYFFGLGPSF